MTVASSPTPERAVVVIQVDFDHSGDENLLLAGVVDGLREFFRGHRDSPVGNVMAAIGGDAQRVLDVFDHDTEQEA